MKIKVCSKCKQTLIVGAFYKDIRRKDGLANPCKHCKRKYEKTQHAKSLGFNRMLTHRYGITVEGYNQLFVAQKGKCVVCNTHQSVLKRKLDVDHDHKTTKVRGLLCNYCNKIVERHINSPAHFKNPIIVRALEGYLNACYKK